MKTREQMCKKYINQISHTLFDVYLYLSHRFCEENNRRASLHLKNVVLLVDVNISTRNSSETFRIKAICCFFLFRTSHVTILQSGVQHEISPKGEKVNTYSKRQIWMENTK